MWSLCRKRLLKNAKIAPILSKTLSTTTCARNELQIQNGCIKNITVVGGGIMGSGIAQVSAQSGFKVVVVDTDEYTQSCMVSIIKSLNIIAKKKFPDEPKGGRKFIDDVLDNIKTTQHLENGLQNTDLVVEAVLENLPIKQEIFKKIDEITANKDVIFASNTSSLSIDEIGKYISYPERFAGLHFFNPVWKMKLTEVVKASKTSNETMEKLTAFSKDLGKTPVISCDNLGFIVNRLMVPYLMESLRFLERGHASVKDIDTAMRLGAGYPMGPFEIIDIIGLDIVKSIVDGWHSKEPENPLFFPSEILNNLVLEQKLGRKTGIGFYKYKHTLY